MHLLRPCGTVLLFFRAAPVIVGQVVVADLLGTGVDVVATKSFA